MSHSISRRQFLKLSASTMATFAIASRNPLRVTKAQTTTPFSIPTLLEHRRVGNQKLFDLSMQSGLTEFWPGQQTPTFGYNGNYLGPTIVVNRGDNLVFNVTNNLGEPTTTHWHGMHVPAVMDGTAHQTIPHGETWTARYRVLNRAGTYWYHPHTHAHGALDEHGTGAQVYKGLAGMLIVRDNETDQLRLPNHYGVDDIPLIIQDRAFHGDGSFNYFPYSPDFYLRKGDHFLVNGAIAPSLNTHAQMIRFRVHNASNARILNLGFSDNRTFYQIGTDAGLLEAPVARTRLLLTPAERAEIVVDFNEDAGATVQLCSYSSELGETHVPNGISDSFDRSDYDIFTLYVGEATRNPIRTIPNRLVTVRRIRADEAVNAASPRRFELVGATINGLSMDMGRIDATVNLGDTEVWEIINLTEQTHPFHVHGDSFQILSRDGNAPPDYEMGWKDVVLVKPNEMVRIIKRFKDFANPTVPYMFHCHILIHEDAGMMGQFVVVDPNAADNIYLPIVKK